MVVVVGVDACPRGYGLLWNWQLKVTEKAQRLVLTEVLVIIDCAIVLQKQSHAVFGCRSVQMVHTYTAIQDTNHMRDFAMSHNATSGVLKHA